MKQGIILYEIDDRTQLPERPDERQRVSSC
jgi:hypothetical protein